MEIIHDTGANTWTGATAYVKSLGGSELIRLLSWLWLWDLFYASAHQWDMETREHVRRHYKHNPFEGVESIPGKIITQVQRGHSADLNQEDWDQLQMAIEERRQKYESWPALV